MGDPFLENAAPRPRYDDPAPLGGSFVFSYANHPGRTSEFPGEREVGLGDQIRLVTKDTPQSTRDQHEKLLQAAASICDTLLLLIADSLAVATRSEWHQYWQQNLQEFDEMMHSLMHFAHRHGLVDKSKGESSIRRRALFERFPGAAGELDFIISVVDDAYSQARSFSTIPVTPDKTAADLAAYGRFRFYGAAFSMCMMALYYITDHQELGVSQQVLDAIFEHARHAALKYNHAVMEATSLRESEAVEESAPVTAIIVPDDGLEDVEMAIRAYEAGNEAKV